MFYEIFFAVRIFITVAQLRTPHHTEKAARLVVYLLQLLGLTSRYFICTTLHT